VSTPGSGKLTQQSSLRVPESAPQGTDGAPSFRRAGTIHGLFSWCVREFPGATALVHGGSRLTYAELDALSDHYACELERAGVVPGDFVPVAMKRSAHLVAMLLGVLKRGAAYSAMDTSAPQPRLAALVARLRPRLVVTGMEGPWPAPSWMPADYAPAGPRRRPGPVPAGAGDPCTVLFTSGSTGTPKGVVSAHRGTVRLFDDCDWMPLGPGVTMPQMASASWDGFTVDCWGPLLTGGTTVIVDEPILVPAALSELRGRDGVNVVFLTPSLFNMLTDEDVRSFSGLDAVLIGGEKASPVHARRFIESNPGTRLINLYGPSECGILVTAHDISLADCESPDGIPLGHAVPHTRIHILDGPRVCQAGELGEICLAGAGLAIGYLDDAELTARQFTDAGIEGTRTRIYRTGDLGHWSPDGNLCFDGRMDLQVQVHGYRVEPEEIEQTAAQVSGVTMTAVVPLRRDGQVDALALFYASPQAGLSEAALRAELSRRLPAYLVPRRIRRLDRFPLLASGKLDRKLMEAIVSAAEPEAVPAGEPAVPAARAVPEAAVAGEPRSATEIAVAGVFAEILGAQAVPRTVSFFELGGDSLSVARVCARLGQIIGAKVQVSQVFRTPSVAQLAAWLDAAASAPATVATPGTEPGADGLIPLTPMQSVHVDKQLATKLSWWVDGALDEDALMRAATDLHRRHQPLHARYVVSGDGRGKAVLPADPGEAEFHRLPPAADDAAAVEAARAVLKRPFKIDQGELWRCVLVRSLATGRRLFGVSAHHIAFDGTSARVLITELSEAYAARVAGSAPRFAGPAATLADFETDYRDQVAASDPQAQRRFWANELRGLRPSRFPGHSGAPPSFLGPAAARRFTVEAGQLRPWEEYGPSRGMTPFVWMAAAYTDALIKAGADPDLSLWFAYAKRGNDLLDRGMTSRMGIALLRPNAPFRRGGNLLTRTRDAYNKARAAQDLFLDPKEMRRALEELGIDYAPLQGCPYLLFHDMHRPAIRLGDARVRYASEVFTWTSIGAELCLEVQAGPAGFAMALVIRTDVYPVELAGTIGELLSETIGEGPERLALRTAS
jgi:mycobactin peptide synthetase MbtE